MVIFSKVCNAYISSIRFSKDNLGVEICDSIDYALVVSIEIADFLCDILNGTYLDCVVVGYE